MSNVKRSKTGKKQIKLPEEVCALDIETADLISRKKRPLEETPVAIVGVKRFVLENGDYSPREYRCFRATEMPELAAFLAAFAGVIVGHNILDFDYRVLRPHVALDNLIARTADTLYFLFERNNQSLNGLSLDTVCLNNFGDGKTISGKSIPAMWQQGKQDEVIRYNEGDCDLTFRLWWEMVRERQIVLYVDWGDLFWYKLTDKDVHQMTCTSPMVTYAAWDRRIARDGRLMQPIFQPRQPDYTEYPFDERQVYGKEIEYQTFYCQQCDLTTLYECRIMRGADEFEQAYCPTCKTELGEVREDVGMPTVIGSLPGNAGRTVSQGLVEGPFESLIRERIEATRSEWEQPAETLPLMEDRCDICNRPQTPANMLHQNNISDGLICLECLTAGRWILTVK